MDRREFLKNSAALTAATVIAPEMLSAEGIKESAQAPDGEQSASGRLIASAPMLQNYASESIGVAFAVNDWANGYVLISDRPDMAGARKVKCGGYRVTDLNDRVQQIRVTGLKPATRYYYRIGADRIQYKAGYSMKITGNEEDPRVYSFVTAGKGAEGHFCVVNDTHAHFDTFDKLTEKIAALAPSCVVWNGDATNCEERIDSQVRIFLDPPITRKDYASEIPYLFAPGNHDSRGMANRHFERLWMWRQPEERISRDWDLGRNFAVRMGDIAMIGLDTAEDKRDTNPLFAGLFNSEAYREAQVDWLRDALKKKEIATAPFLVAFCHIPLFDDDPTHNPGDVAPADKDPRYSADFAYWQRTCAKLWTPLLQKAKCQLIVTAHMHTYRYDAPDGTRKWGHLVGGGPEWRDEVKFPTVIEGRVEGRRLHISVHNIHTGAIQDEYWFNAR
jgi:hypothetical protein